MMGKKLTMKVHKTITTEFAVDLEYWYSWSELSEKIRFQKIQWAQDNPDKLLEDADIEISDESEEFEIVEWDIIENE